MKILSFNNSSKTPLYIQMYEQIKENIENGELVANEKLPSKKNFMDNYKLSQNTIQNALYLLLEEGYIYSKERKGYFVSNIENLIQQISKPVFTKQEKAKNQRIKYDFSYLGVDKKSVPKSTLKKITKDIYDEENDELLVQGDIQGYLPLRKTICKYLKKSRGVDSKPEQIIISSGTEYLFHIIFNFFKNKIYGLENPGYKMLPQLFKANNINFEAINLDVNGILIEELKEKKVSIACVSPSHQFPSGIIMSVARRNELLNWANKNKKNYIIEDDYDSEFKYNGRAIPALKAIDINDKVIYIGNFSKSISPAVRVSYMVLPTKLLKIYRENLPYFICPVSTLTQKILYEFMEKGYFIKHINRMRNIYKKKREEIVINLKKYSLEILGEEIEIQGADAGLHLLIKIPKTIDKKKFFRNCEKNQLKIYSLKEYYLEKEEENFLMMGYANFEKEEITEAINLLVKLMNKSKKQSKCFENRRNDII